MSKLPKQYQAPLRTRKAVVAWLNNDRARGYEARGGHDYEAAYADRRHRGPWLFCFNVKLRGRLDTSFATMLKLAVSAGVLTSDHLKDVGWLKAAKQRRAATNTDGIYDHALASCSERFVSCYNKNHAPGDDGFSMLPDGTPVAALFAFMGRSGGWLVLMSFNGHRLDAEAQGTARTWEHWDFQDLVKLYKFLVMLEHDVRPQAVLDSVAAEMVGSFFANVCHDLPLTVDLKGEGI